ncbi:lipopolysaccharide assembly protein LapB [Neptuniibacter sp. QD37_6]|uniref:lipopolysaccharide assembly protein LapB n=1 Tax=Neptuniibacter sp. QD37_6 TaxID=3398210 RepID=UPI0039F5A479
MPFNLDNAFLLIPFVLAIGIGWLLGRRDKQSKPTPPQTNLSHEYFTGLDYLLNEKMDEAIESFIRALEINSDTIPAHLSLAKLFRRKGDVDRAIQIHQNLLARPNLARDDFMRIQMALANDYYFVGLLDRAENLLQEIIKSSPPKRIHSKALNLLIKLYEKEREWEEALVTADKLSADERRDLNNELAHYCCELADMALQQKLIKAATEYLKDAEQFDSDNVRVSFLKAQIAMKSEQWKQAIKHLKKVSKQDRLFVSETIPLLKDCYERTGDSKGHLEYLRSCLANSPSTTVLIALAEHVKEERGIYAAGSFITEELKRRPSVKGFNSLIDLHIEYGSDSAKDSLKVLRGLTGQLELSKPVYRCNSCGFSGRTLSWQCPSCKSWGTTKPIQGLEGE